MKEINIKQNKAVTLVALIITMAILLILAGVSISVLTDDDKDIMNKAQSVIDKTEKVQDDTTQTIQGIQDEVNSYLIGESGGNGEGSSTISQGVKVPDDTLYADFITSDKTTIPVPGGYKVTNDTNEISKGIVIQDDLGNQFVWVPVSSEQLTRMYDATNKRGNLYDFGTYNSSTETWTPYETPQIKTYSASSYREPDILTDTTDGDASTTAGKGISQLKDVVGITATVGAADENQSILDNWKKELQDKFDEMIKSVERYKGFYIGRYETGSWLADKTNIPKVQKGQTVTLSSGLNWYQQYTQTKNLSKIKNASNNYIDNPNVITSMIWGCQFDRTLEWIAQTNLTEDGKANYGLLTDSRSWGNYYNYKEVTGDTSTAEAGTKTLPSGTNPNWQKNNIFDLAGNAWDWTIEANYTPYRVKRGGCCSTSGSYIPASSRYNNYPLGSDSNLGSRSTLYVKLNTGS